MSAPGQRRELSPRWTGRAGAWVGLGASPGALVLGAGIASRHEGPAPLVALVLAAAAMSVLLWTQGRLGLVPPLGEGQDLSDLGDRYFTSATRRTISWLLAASMVGWFGFNSGLGGAALASILGLPGPFGPLLIGGGVLLLARGGIPRWNAFTLAATAGGLLLVVLVLGQLPRLPPPVGLTWPASTHLALDVAAFIGYVAVFSVRAPDFTVGLGRRSDVWWSIVVLCGGTFGVALTGIVLHRATGVDDVIAVLSREPGLAVGNALIAVAVFAPMLTSVHSGALALRSAARLPLGVGMTLIVTLGVALGVARFDRQLLFWLALLAAALPPVIIPLAAERWHRRRKHPPRRIPVWVWGVPGLLALGLVLLEQPVATSAGLLSAAALTAGWLWSAARSGQRGV